MDARCRARSDVQTRIELVSKLKPAPALGLTIPQSLLRADQMIQ
jgi:hypothetical protein